MAMSCFSACISVGDMQAPSVTEGVGFSTDADETKSSSEPSDTQSSTNEETSAPVQTNKKKTIKFVGAGDVLIHSAIYREAEALAANKSGYSGNYYFKDMYNGISKLVADADIAFANHEAPIAKTSIAGYPNFNAPSESGDTLVDLGFNVINIANNHMFDVDHKVTGYADTIDYWDTKDVLQIGGYKSEADFDKVRILDVEGIKVAFLGYTYDPYLTNRGSMNKKTEEAGYVLPLLDDDVLARHITNAKKVADIVIVSAHWGTENVSKPVYEQERLAQIMADNGADVILGHHSHTLQDMKWLTGSNGNKTLCIYSLGNLISGMLSTKNAVGGFITFDIVKENGKATIESPVFVPTVCHYDIKDFKQKDPEGNPVRTGFQIYLLEDYTEALAAKHGTQNYGKFTLSTLKGYVTSVIPSEFRPDFLK